jgi:hypothetical protein
MAKVAGFLTSLTVQDNGAVARDITNDVTDLSLNIGINQLDITGLDKTAIERMNLRGDVTLTMNGIVNNASNKSHDVFKTIHLSTAVARQVVMTTVAGPVFTVTVLFSAYNVTPGADGSLKFSVNGALSSGTTGAWT